MEERHDVTVPMPQSLVDEIDKNLEYGDSRSQFTRQALRLRLEIEQEHIIEFRREFLEEAVREKLERERSDETATA